MNTELLRESVFRFSERFPWLGVGPDIAAMTAGELEAVLRFLRRISEGD